MRTREVRFVTMVLAGTIGCSGVDAAGDGGTSSSFDASLRRDGGATTATDGATVDSPFRTDPTGRVLCSDGQPCACDNGVDDDGDGAIDGADAECTGPYDDDEGSFSTGIPGDNIDFCQDCFFDGDSGGGGGGTDPCQYHTDCLYGETPPPRGGSGCFSCDVSSECVDTCRVRTPNGCDCFGCCEVFREGGSSVFVYLASTCSYENLDDETACPRCVQDDECVNECGECELCPGRSIDDLPESCTEMTDGGTPTPTCDEGQQVCDESNPCPENYYCQLGCCLPTIF